MNGQQATEEIEKCDTFQTLHWPYQHYTPNLKKEGNMLNVQNTPLTLKDILINCNMFRQIRPKYYQTSNLKDLFKNTKPEEILCFLKEINIFKF